MDPPKFLLNPDAAPFIPNYSSPRRSFKEENVVDITFCGSANLENTEEHEIFDPALQHLTHGTEKLKVSEEDSQRRFCCASEPMEMERQEPVDHIPPYEVMGMEQQDMQDSPQSEIELLSSLFPNFSVESIVEVYYFCGKDVVEATIALEDLEGHDGTLRLPIAQHSDGTASSSSENARSSDPVSP